MMMYHDFFCKSFISPVTICLWRVMFESHVAVCLWRCDGYIRIATNEYSHKWAMYLATNEPCIWLFFLATNEPCIHGSFVAILICGYTYVSINVWLSCDGYIRIATNAYSHKWAMYLAIFFWYRCMHIYQRAIWFFGDSLVVIHTLQKNRISKIYPKYFGDSFVVIHIFWIFQIVKCHVKGGVRCWLCRSFCRYVELCM